jgi:hypothetical protein
LAIESYPGISCGRETGDRHVVKPDGRGSREAKDGSRI